MIGNTNLEPKLFKKSLLKLFCYNNKVTRKVKDFKKLSNKEIYFILQSKSTKYNKLSFSFQSRSSFHGQTSLRNTIFSVLIPGLTLLLVGLRNGLMDSYTFSILHEYINFSLPLNLAIDRIDNTTNILCPRCKKQKESQPYFIFHCNFSKITLDFISELINLKYAFNIPFKITLKTIMMGISSQFHNGVQFTHN